MEAAGYFSAAFAGLEAGPSWLTLNLSCPNTDDDPRGNQSAELARELAGALVAAVDVPIWVKIGPDLSEPQLEAIVHAFGEAGVRAVVATNTLARPTPEGDAVAGVSGTRLRPSALRMVSRLNRTIESASLPNSLRVRTGTMSRSPPSSATSPRDRFTSARCLSELPARGRRCSIPRWSCEDRWRRH